MIHMKIHVIYISIIIILVLALCKVGYPLYVDTFIVVSPDEQFAIRDRLELIDPKTQKVIATLEPGFPFMKPRYHDLVDIGVENDSRFKLLIDVEDIPPRLFTKTDAEWRALILRGAATSGSNKRVNTIR